MNKLDRKLRIQGFDIKFPRIRVELSIYLLCKNNHSNHNVNDFIIPNPKNSESSEKKYWLLILNRL